MITILYIATVFLLVLANGSLSHLSLALVGVRRSRIETLSRKAVGARVGC